MENDSDSRCPTRMTMPREEQICSADCEAVNTLREIFENDEILEVLMSEDASLVVEATTILHNAETAKANNAQ